MDALIACTEIDSHTTVVNNPAAGQEEEKTNAEEEEEVEDKSEKECVENGAGKTPKVEEPTGPAHGDRGETEEPLAENDLMDTREGEQEAREKQAPCIIIVEDPLSEASDSVPTDSRFVTSMSSDSMDALEEDDFLTYFSTNCVSQLNVRDHYLHVGAHAPCPSQPTSQDEDSNDELYPIEFPASDDEFLHHAALSSIAECLPSPTEASEEEYSEQGDDEDEQEAPEDVFGSGERESVFTFNQGDAQRYYNICASVTPDSGHIDARTSSSPHTHKKNREQVERGTEPAPILLPPPGFGDSSSDEEFFDAQERFIPEEPSSAPMLEGTFPQCSLTYTRY